MSQELYTTQSSENCKIFSSLNVFDQLILSQGNERVISLNKIKKNNKSERIYFKVMDSGLFYSKNFQFSPCKVNHYDSLTRAFFMSDYSIQLKNVLKLIKKKKQFICSFDDNDAKNYTESIIKKKLNLIGFHSIYKSVKVLGDGTFSRVYKGKNLITNISCAIKALSKKNITKYSKDQSVLLNEIRILRLLSHENLITLDSIYETENSYYLILELFKGGNLKENIQHSGVFSEEKCIIVLEAILKALVYLHSRKIIHRDIKPDNILLRSKNPNVSEIALGDFGLSTFESDESYGTQKCGTPGYVAPEILAMKDNNKNENYSNKCDLYSVGITFYYMLFGKLPYKCSNIEQLLEQNEICDFEFLQNELSGISKIRKNI